MMRYLKQLADRDYALDRGMIPLGSCTMKLNAATEMAAVTWPEFAALHPFAPASDVAGYLELIGDLETWLAELTGYDTVSLQPNAGSQGELAGLLAIRGYHRSRGDDQRTVCLIPQSAHGTNAASAVLAGLRVVVVATDANGNVDLADLRAKIEANRDELAALMITYPSTHGVYEHDVVEITDAVHEAGGQVYIDGANLNALLGYAAFGGFGGDVSHLNLHKTFCIPHGGGGPGVGPVAAKAHLAPFLPGHPLAQSNEHVGLEHGGAPVSAAPFGSPSILPISWAYVRMMGLDGPHPRDGRGRARRELRRGAAARALPGALRGRERAGRSRVHPRRAHAVGRDRRDRRRRRQAPRGLRVPRPDHVVPGRGHADGRADGVRGPRRARPVLRRDDRDRARGARARRRGLAGRRHPLRGAPHTAESVIAGEWTHPYSRELAVYPAGPAQARVKYWPPVGRIDQAWGDRNLFCACPPPEAFA